MIELSGIFFSDDGKLSFERNERSTSFKRACYVLYDVK